MNLLRTALVAAVVAAPAPLLAAVITSNFTVDADGWQHGAYNNGIQIDVVHNAGAGTISIDNGWYAGGFLAPQKYLGDKLAFLDGTMSFQLATDQVTPPGTLFPALILVGANGETIFSTPSIAPGTSLTDFTISLSAANFYKGTIEQVISGVSDGEFSAILGNLQMVSIFGNWNGGEWMTLDNVQMTSLSSAVPEPASWMMMIAGFGLVGLAMRRAPRSIRLS